MHLSNEQRKKLNQVVALAEIQLDQAAESRQFREQICDSIRKLGGQSVVTEAHLTAALDDPQVRNVLELAALFKAESACLIDDYLRATGFRKSLYGRMLALVSYESALTMREVMGPTFREAVARKLNHAVDDQLKEIHKRICRLFDEIRVHSGELRHSLVAHRSKDLQRRYALMNDADAELIVASAVKLHPALTELQSLLMPYVEKTNSELRTILDRITSSSIASAASVE
jgi:hypothetical protein